MTEHPHPASDRLATIEAALAAIWNEALCVDDASTTDNFLERGGDSVQATQVTWRIAERFSVHLPLTWMLRYPTLHDLAIAVNASSESTQGQRAAADVGTRSRARRRCSTHG